VRLVVRVVVGCVVVLRYGLMVLLGGDGMCTEVWNVAKARFEGYIDAVGVEEGRIGDRLEVGCG